MKTRLLILSALATTLLGACAASPPLPVSSTPQAAPMDITQHLVVRYDEPLIIPPNPNALPVVMTLDELGAFPFDPATGTAIPAQVMALNGERVALKGYLVPFTDEDALTNFALTPQFDGGSGWVQPPPVQKTIICHADPKLQVRYTYDEQVLVTGVLTVKPIRENDFTHMIFQLKVESVKIIKPD